jgi:hypothetical protein
MALVHSCSILKEHVSETAYISVLRLKIGQGVAPTQLSPLTRTNYHRAFGDYDPVGSWEESRNRVMYDQYVASSHWPMFQSGRGSVVNFTGSLIKRSGNKLVTGGFTMLRRGNALDRRLHTTAAGKCT